MKYNLKKGADMDTEKKHIRHTVNSLGWAAFFIMTGILWILPERLSPEGSWLISTGVILLAVNLIKNFLGVKSTSGYFFGSLFTIFGIMRLIETPFRFLPIFLIALGSFTVISGLLEIRIKRDVQSEQFKKENS